MMSATEYQGFYKSNGDVWSAERGRQMMVGKGVTHRILSDELRPEMCDAGSSVKARRRATPWAVFVGDVLVGS